jgi:hypothetical protein
MGKKIIIWGYKNPSHTHHYIHYGWNKAFNKLGYETYWFSDSEHPEEGTFDYGGSIFITEGYVDDKIPLVNSSTYFVHVCKNPEKYIGKVGRLVDMRYLVDHIKDCNYNYKLDKSNATKISNATYWERLHDNSGVSSASDNPTRMEYEAMYTCWATDLLPDEIDDRSIMTQRENSIYWFGSARPENNAQVRKFSVEAEKNGIKFISNDPWVNPQSFETVREYTAKSFMSPDIRTAGDPNKIAIGETGTCHKDIGYIACRLFKAISYGQLGVTNSKHMYDIMEESVIYDFDEASLFYKALPHMKDYELIKKQMNIVKEKHTFINRALDLMCIFNISK